MSLDPGGQEFGQASAAAVYSMWHGPGHSLCRMELGVALGEKAQDAFPLKSGALAPPGSLCLGLYKNTFLFCIR